MASNHSHTLTLWTGSGMWSLPLTGIKPHTQVTQSVSVNTQNVQPTWTFTSATNACEEEYYEKSLQSSCQGLTLIGCVCEKERWMRLLTPSSSVMNASSNQTRTQTCEVLKRQVQRNVCCWDSTFIKTPQRHTYTHQCSHGYSLIQLTDSATESASLLACNT